MNYILNCSMIVAGLLILFIIYFMYRTNKIYNFLKEILKYEEIKQNKLIKNHFEDLRKKQNLTIEDIYNPIENKFYVSNYFHISKELSCRLDKYVYSFKKFTYKDFLTKKELNYLEIPKELFDKKI